MAWVQKRSEVSELSERIQWYAYIRLFFLIAIAVPGTITLYAFEGLSEQVQHDIALATFAVSSNLIFFVLTKLHGSQRYQSYLTVAWIMFDILLITALIFIKGGIESRSPILYSIPILVSAAIFGKRAAYGSAMIAALSYVSLIIADYQGLIHSFGAFDPTLRLNLPYVLNTIVFFPAVIFLIALAVDFITQLLFVKQQQLRESLDSLVRAQEIAKLGSWEWDVKKDEVTWSSELYKIFDVKQQPKRLKYSEYLKKLHPEDAKVHKKRIASALKTRTGFQANHRIITPSGETRYIHAEGQPLVGADGSVVKITGVTQDVTMIYSLDSAKREFVSLASHQLRTPASGVKAFLSLLLDGYGGKLSRKQQEFAKKAYDSNDRQLEIIENLLSLASIESGKLKISKEPIDLHAIIRRNIASHRHIARINNQKIVFRKETDAFTLRADPSSLEMALDNLISNALKYTPSGGTVTIETQTTSTSVYVAIVDNGIGIAKKDVPELFHKFSRLNDPASKTVGGSGLGLYLAASIVRLHGGSIRVKSVHGEGSTFTIRLPLSVKKR